ncbi:cell envelope integrity protein TolA [Rickettsiella grylli]|uniref:Proline-rich region n=1 Tax=Rickettsiella grylli TaxID=59196 RepID=A8PMC0_9COXI|nr:cell envelope integrity protein TolA [Rickettsiella grylli]EDP46100.1 proline-rich region [Rickettsiella grylli]
MAALLLHFVLFLALFLTVRHHTTLVSLSSPAVQWIHATAIPMDTLVKKKTPPVEKIKIPTEVPKPSEVTKPLKSELIKKSPVVLPLEKKKVHKNEQKQITSHTRNKQSLLIKKRMHLKTTKIEKKIMHKPKKMTHQPISKKSLKLVEKNVQQLLDQELKTLEKQSIHTSRYAATMGKYRHLILQAIAQQWIIPPEMNKHLETQLTVHLAPGGLVLDVIIVKSSGNLILDRSAQTAVYKASPLPVPKNEDLFHTFRHINLIVRPEGVITQ